MAAVQLGGGWQNGLETIQIAQALRVDPQDPGTTLSDESATSVLRACGFDPDDLRRGGFDLFNICSGDATELRSLLLEIAAAMTANPDLLRFGARGMRPGEAPVSYGDNSKAKTQLAWRPRDLARALREDLLAVAAEAAQ